MAKAAKKPKTREPTPAEAMLREASGLMLSGGQVSRLRHAMRLEGGNDREKREAETIVRSINKELGSGILESVNLELARGGVVEQGSFGPIRMKSRDGLQSLLESKHGLSTEQYETGLRFREGWELRSADVGSQMGGGEGGAGHDNDRFVAVRLTRAKKLTATTSMERRVALECRDEPACLQMLRWVAGEGQAINAFGEGRAFYRHVEALKRALDVAGGQSS